MANLWLALTNVKRKPKAILNGIDTVIKLHFIFLDYIIT